MTYSNGSPFHGGGAYGVGAVAAPEPQESVHETRSIPWPVRARTQHVRHVLETAGHSAWCDCSTCDMARREAYSQVGLALVTEYLPHLLAGGLETLAEAYREESQGDMVSFPEYRVTPRQSIRYEVFYDAQGPLPLRTRYAYADCLTAGQVSGVKVERAMFVVAPDGTCERDMSARYMEGVLPPRTVSARYADKGRKAQYDGADRKARVAAANAARKARQAQDKADRAARLADMARQAQDNRRAASGKAGHVNDLAD